MLVSNSKLSFPDLVSQIWRKKIRNGNSGFKASLIPELVSSNLMHVGMYKDNIMQSQHYMVQIMNIAYLMSSSSSVELTFRASAMATAPSFARPL